MEEQERKTPIDLGQKVKVKRTYSVVTLRCNTITQKVYCLETSYSDGGTRKENTYRLWGQKVKDIVTHSINNSL